MNGQTIINFQNITKYPLIDFLKKYQDFLLNNYNSIYAYFAGRSVSIDNDSLVALKYLTNEIKNLQAQFKNFSNRFNNCEYWELLDYVDDLNNTLEKINKLPKYLRTSLSKRGYTPTVQTETQVGAMRTMDDIANAVSGHNNDSTSWIDLMLNNDLNEYDWEIDEPSNVTVYLSNINKIVVTTILDMPIGKRVYGKDIARKITFEDNDLAIVKEEANVEQKCSILLTLHQGDVPENMLLGVNPSLIATNVKGYTYSEIVAQLRNTFLQNDLFSSVTVNNFSFNNGDMQAEVKIKTKYDYETEKQITI